MVETVDGMNFMICDEIKIFWGMGDWLCLEESFEFADVLFRQLKVTACCGSLVSWRVRDIQKARRHYSYIYIFFFTQSLHY